MGTVVGRGFGRVVSMVEYDHGRGKSLVSDEDIETLSAGASAPQPGGDADGTDGDSTDSTDGDATDGDASDGDSTDTTDGDASDAGDGGDADGTDA